MPAIRAATEMMSTFASSKVTSPKKNCAVARKPSAPD
jgi:hypothetical protein